MSNSLSVDDNAERNDRPWHISKTWVVLGLLVLTHAAFGAWFNPNGTGSGDATIRMSLLGFLVSQPILFAIWASFAHQRFYYRFLWSLLLCTLVSFAQDLGTLRLANHHDLGVLMIIDAALFLAATVILSLFRRFSRWRIKRPDREDVPSAYQTHQVGIKHVIILTTIIALACGLFRTLHNINPDMTPPPSIAEFICGLCSFLALLFPVVAMPWITLAYRRRLLAPIFIMIIIGAVLDVAAYVLIITMEPSNPGFGAYGLIIQLLSMQLGATVSALATTLVIRFCGFRMIREAKGHRVRGR